MSFEVFSRKAALPVPAEEAFAWHERPGALERLIPPWEDVRVVSHGDGLRNGSRVVMVIRQGPLRIRWVAEHCDYQNGRQFRDIQVEGPFKHWGHTHTFLEEMPEGSALEDRVEYRLRGGAIGKLAAGRAVRTKIARMFAYRHAITAADLAAHAKYHRQGAMHVAITGSHGLIGRELVPFLTTGGHRVTALVRGEASQGQVSWDPAVGALNASELDGVDGVVHLAGENIATSRWTEVHKRRVVESRVQGTRLLCEALAKLASPPKVLVSASAIGLYGDRGDEILDENSPSGEGFLASVAREWEAATEPAAAAGIRVVHIRLGIVLSPRGGALAKMLTPFKMGAGGPIGNGRQYWSWISVDDAVGAIHHALMTNSLHGPMNVVSPDSVTNMEFTKTLGRVLSRPSVARVPAFAARLALGEMAEELLLASTRVQPKRLVDSEYRFRHDSLEDAFRHLLGRTT